MDFICFSGIFIQTPPPTVPPISFWNKEQIIAALIGAAVTALLSPLIIWLARHFWKWLVHAVESLGLGFQKRYTRHLIQEHQWLKLIGVWKAGLERPRLKEVFVPLRLNIPDAQDAPSFDWSQLFQCENKHIVILGQPGSGKSTLMDYLTLVFCDYIHHSLYRQNGQPLPVYLHLKDLKDQPIISLIESQLDNTPKGFFERLLAAGKCILILDGLDEVLDETAHDWAVKQIKDQAADYPECWILITCRIAGWRGQLPGFQCYQILDFDQNDIQKFISVWYREVLRSKEINELGLNPKLERIREAEGKAYREALERASDLWESLRANRDIYQIAHTPLILSLITLVHYARTTDLPKGRARLYERCLEILLDEWDFEDKRLKIPNNPSVNDKLLVLKYIAFASLAEGWLDLDARGLENIVNPLLPKLTVSIEAKELIILIYERSGILWEKAIGRYGFAHRALADYLAAKYIQEKGLDGILINHASEERWREVTLIAIGLVGENRAETLLSTLIQGDPPDAYALALAGYSLLEDIQVNPRLRNNIKESLIFTLNRAENLGQFVPLSAALFATDPVITQEWVKSILIGRDVRSRKRVLSFLPELGEYAKPMVPLLIQMIEDKNHESEVRIQSIIALARLGIQDDLEIWRILTTARHDNYLPIKRIATWAYCELGRYVDLGLVKVPAGDFLMGSDKDKDKDAEENEFPQHSLYLPTFYISHTPVSLSEWCAFNDATYYPPKSRDRSMGSKNTLVAQVSWHEAIMYASWQGMFLPTEAEWEKAARGTDGRIYPWGDEWMEIPDKIKDKKMIVPVDMFSPQCDSPYGCVGMSGISWEWTHSKYRLYPYRPEDGREDSEVTDRVGRGGINHKIIDRFCRCALRRCIEPLHNNKMGFRVVVSPILLNLGRSIL